MGFKARFIAVVASAVVGMGLLWTFAFRDKLFGEDSSKRLLGTTLNFDTKLLNVAGEAVQLKEILSKSPKNIVALWATWCDPCIEELPLIQKSLAAKKAEQTQVVLINFDGGDPDRTIPEVKAWLISQRLSLETYFDVEGELLDYFQTSMIPFAVGVGSSGKINWVNEGPFDWAAPKWKLE